MSIAQIIDPKVWIIWYDEGSVFEVFKTQRQALIFAFEEIISQFVTFDVELFYEELTINGYNELTGVNYNSDSFRENMLVILPEERIYLQESTLHGYS